MSYYLAPSLVRLRAQINAKWPKRDTSSDGWIGDPSHAARVSDHNPDYSNGGVVRAIDVDIDGIDVNKLMKVLKKDSRVNYFIYNHSIYGASQFAKRAYNGANAHTKHIHISIKHTGAAEYDHAWKLDGILTNIKSGKKTNPTPTKATDKDRKIQERLKAMGLYKRSTDGVNGKYQQAAVKAFQKAHKLVQDGAWGPKTEAKFDDNVKLQKALNLMKSTTPKLTVDGYLGKPTERRIADVLKRNRWSRRELTSKLKDVGAWK